MTKKVLVAVDESHSLYTVKTKGETITLYYDNTLGSWTKRVGGKRTGSLELLDDGTCILRLKGVDLKLSFDSLEKIQILIQALQDSGEIGKYTIGELKF